ncbi:hypothetical protein J6590_044212 [Homalodisca vitripennis]|nr:hypothetical protein J6590_044212 [Homalodisca vitripennis]
MDRTAHIFKFRKRANKDDSVIPSPQCSRRYRARRNFVHKSRLHIPSVLCHTADDRLVLLANVSIFNANWLPSRQVTYYWQLSSSHVPLGPHAKPCTFGTSCQVTYHWDHTSSHVLLAPLVKSRTTGTTHQVTYHWDHMSSHVLLAPLVKSRTNGTTHQVTYHWDHTPSHVLLASLVKSRTTGTTHQVTYLWDNTSSYVLLAPLVKSPTNGTTRQVTYNWHQSSIHVQLTPLVKPRTTDTTLQFTYYWYHSSTGTTHRVTHYWPNCNGLAGNATYVVATYYTNQGDVATKVKFNNPTASCSVGLTKGATALPPSLIGTLVTSRTIGTTRHVTYYWPNCHGSVVDTCDIGDDVPQRGERQLRHPQPLNASDVIGSSAWSSYKLKKC